jgi:hypothetical protein
MKKLSVILLSLLMVFTVACSKTEDTDAPAKGAKTTASGAKDAQNAKAEKPATKAQTTAALSYNDYAIKHGIALETDYNMFGNSNWGSMALMSDGTVSFYSPEEGEYSALWYADEAGVYVVNEANEEFSLGIHQNGNVFVVDSVPCVIDGFENTVSCFGTYSFDDNHAWADVLEFDGSNAGWYTDLEEGGVYAEGATTVITFEDYAIITPREYDGNKDPLILATSDGGQTFEDENGRVFRLSDTGGNNDSNDDSGESNSDSNAVMALQLGVILDQYYLTANDTNNYFYVGSDGYFYITDPVAGTTVDLNYYIDGNYIHVYDGAGTEVAVLLFSGEVFLEEDSGLTYYPYETYD